MRKLSKPIPTILLPLAGLFFLFAIPAGAQIGSVPTDQLGTSRAMSQVHDPTRRAADAYARGARAMHKAEKAKDAKEKQKQYDRAKEELTKSLQILPTYDAYLALGQVQLAVGDPRAAASACTEAQSLKPGDEAAKACLEQANKPPAATMPAGAVPPPQTGG
jgi:tetratricopeptide (TPR) repeat protein